MSELWFDPRLQGIREQYEGLRDFPDFADYLENRVKPNLLEDLDTVFEGAKLSWAQKVAREPNRQNGRGDFVMATALLAVFDHIGSFITQRWEDPVTPPENIARVARQLA